MKAKNCLPGPGGALSAVLKATVLLAGAQAALAQSPSLPHANGLLVLPNVRIETAGASQVAAASRTPSLPAQAGVRAYKDPTTGELREPTAEEMDAEGYAKSAYSGGAKSVQSAYGGVLMLLDDSFMSNAVVTKDAAGKARMQCVTGDHKAVDAALHGLPSANFQGKAGRVHRHD